MRPAVFCGQCARRQHNGTYRRCPDCRTALCRRRRDCGTNHNRQCPAVHKPQEAL